MIYLVHAIFYAPFALRIFGMKTGESVKRAPAARLLVGFHMLAFGLTYFGIGRHVFGHLDSSDAQKIAGAAVILLSGAWAAWALLVFRSWRFSAELDAQHELCTKGPFRYTRHPIYLALAGLAIGSAIWMPDPFTIAGAICNALAGDLRARSEEKLLTEGFGDRYRDYMKGTRRFIPFLYMLLLALPAHADLDVKSLDAPQKKMLQTLMDKYPSPCGKAHSLATSLNDKSCKRAPYAGKFLVFLVGLGLTQDEVQQHYEDRFVNPASGRCKPGPIRGDEKAAITICEFSDFQCPHCKAAEPILKKILDDYKGKVKLVFKNFPLSSHPDAHAAAAAAVSAGLQGKFWQMHDRLFEHQDKMSGADIEKDARELKLDLEKWRANLGPAGAQVDADRGEGLVLKIDHTPTFFIDGREYKGPLRYEFMKDWIDEALASR